MLAADEVGRGFLRPLRVRATYSSGPFISYGSKFGELRTREVRRIHLPRTQVNKSIKKNRGVVPRPLLLRPPKRVTSP